MYIINIVPAQNVEAMQNTKMMMFLTHLCLKYPEYKAFAKRYKGFKILDNSLIELGAAMNFGTVLRVAKEIGANEVVLPDVFQDTDATLAAVSKALDKFEKPEGMQYMAVVHGRTKADVARCMETYEQIPEIDTLGIPKVLSKTFPRGRATFESLWADSTKNVHLLGLWYSFNELEYYEDKDRIRSMDSCQLAWLVRNKVDIWDGVRPDGHTIDLERPLSSREMEILGSGMDWLRRNY